MRKYTFNILPVVYLWYILYHFFKACLAFITFIILAYYFFRSEKYH